MAELVMRMIGKPEEAIAAAERLKRTIYEIRPKPVRLEVQSTQAEASLHRTKRALGEVEAEGSRVYSRMRSMATGLGGFMAAIGLETIVERTVGQARTFGDVTRNFVAQTGVHGKAVKQWSDTIRSVARSSEYDMKSIGTAATSMAADLGMTTGQFKSHQEALLTFSRFAGGDLQQNLNGVVRLLRAYGIQNRELTPTLDKLVAAQQRFRLPVSESLTALSQGRPYFRAFGLDLNQSVALLAQFSQRGIDTSNVIRGLGTAVSRATKEYGGPGGATAALQKHLDKIKALEARHVTTAAAADQVNKKIQAEAAAYDATKKAIDAAGGAHASVSSILRNEFMQVENARSAQERFNLAVNLFGGQAGPRIAEALSKGGDQFRKISDSTKRAEGDTERLANVYKHSLGAQLEIARHQLDDTGITIGKTLAPALVTGTRWLANMAAAVHTLVTAIPGLRGALGVVAGASLLGLAGRSELIGAPIRATLGRLPGAPGRFFSGGSAVHGEQAPVAAAPVITQQQASIGGLRGSVGLPGSPQNPIVVVGESIEATAGALPFLGGRRGGVVAAEQATLAGGFAAGPAGFRSTVAIQREQAAMLAATRGAAYSPVERMGGVLVPPTTLGGRLLARVPGGGTLGGFMGAARGAAMSPLGGAALTLLAPLLAGGAGSIAGAFGVGHRTQGYVRGITGGATAGAGIGTMIFPGLGTAVGAGIGALAGAITSGLASAIFGDDSAANRSRNAQRGAYRQGRGLGGETQRRLTELMRTSADTRAEAAAPRMFGTGPRPSLRPAVAAERQIGTLIGGEVSRQALGAGGGQAILGTKTLDDWTKRLATMPAVARQSASRMMIATAETLVKDGRLPADALKRWIASLGPRFADLENVAKVHGGRTAKSFADALRSDEAAKALRDQRTKLVAGAQTMVDALNKKWPDAFKDVKVTNANAGREVSRGMAFIKYQMQHGTSEGRAFAKANYDKMVADVAAWRKEHSAEVNKARSAMVQGTAKMSGASVANVQSLMNSVALGYGWFGSQSAAILKALGVKAQQFGVKMPPNLASAAGAAAGGSQGSSLDAFYGSRGTRVPGARGPDTLAIVAPTGMPIGYMAPGELIVASSTERRIDRMLAPYGTSLYGEVEAETVPHYATGGVSGLANIVGAKRWALDQMGKPYGWGAGHSYGTWPKYDCSGFATNVATRAGYTGGIGTTYDAIAKSTAARGGEPVQFGFSRFGLKGHQGPGHMGIRILGTVMQFGNPGHTGGSFPVWKVPQGIPSSLNVNLPTPLISGPGSEILAEGRGGMRYVDRGANRGIGALIAHALGMPPVGAAEGDRTGAGGRTAHRFGGRIRYFQTGGDSSFGTIGVSSTVSAPSSGITTSTVVPSSRSSRGRHPRARKPPATSHAQNPLTGRWERHTAAEWRVIRETVKRRGGAHIVADELAGLSAAEARALEHDVVHMPSSELGGPTAAAVMFAGQQVHVDLSQEAGVAQAQMVAHALQPIRARLTRQLARAERLRKTPARENLIARVEKALGGVDSALATALGTMTGAGPVAMITGQTQAHLAAFQRFSARQQGSLRLTAEAGARARGLTGDAVTRAGDVVVNQEQQREKQQERDEAHRAISRLRGQVRKLNAQRKAVLAHPAKYGGPVAAHATARALLRQIRDIRLQIAGYNQDILDAGGAIEQLKADETAAETPPTLGTQLLAAAGLETSPTTGQLTAKGQADTIAAYQQLVKEAQDAYTAAVASGNAQNIVSASNDLAAANQNLASALGDVAQQANDAAQALKDQMDNLLQITTDTAKLDAAWLQTVSAFGDIGQGARTALQAAGGDPAAAAPGLANVFGEGLVNLMAAGALAQQEAALPHYQGGTDFVPDTGPAILHRGEQVIAAGGGSGDLHLHVHSHTLHPASPAHHREIASTVIRALNSQGYRVNPRRRTGV